MISGLRWTFLRSFAKGLAERGGWREEIFAVPEIETPFLHAFSYAPLRRRGRHFWRTFWAVFPEGPKIKKIWDFERDWKFRGRCSGGCSGELGVLQRVLPRVLNVERQQEERSRETPWNTPNSPEHPPEHPPGALPFRRAPLGALPRALPWQPTPN